MESNVISAPYEKLLDAFKSALGLALDGETDLDVDQLGPIVSLSLLDIAHAARDRKSTSAQVTLACAAFAVYAGDQDAVRRASRVGGQVRVRRRPRVAKDRPGPETVASRPQHLAR